MINKMETIPLLADTIFPSILPGFKASNAQIIKDTLTIPFEYTPHITVKGIMVFEIFTSPLYVTFNPFLSSPQSFEQNGIDWVRMKYLDRREELYEFERQAKELLQIDANGKT